MLLFVSVLLAFLLKNVLGADFPSMRAVKMQRFEDILNPIKTTVEEVETTRDAVMSFFDLYAFKDPAKLYEKNQMHESRLDLETVLTTYFEDAKTTLPNVWSFYNAIAEIYSRAHDSHLLFIKPKIFWTFFYVFPYDISIREDNKYYLEEKSDIAKLYNIQLEPLTLTSHITKISVEYAFSNETDVFENPAEYIKKYSDIDAVGKNPHARYNYTYTLGLSVRLPLLFVNKFRKLIIEFEDGTNAELPFYMCNIGETIENFADAYEIEREPTDDVKKAKLGNIYQIFKHKEELLSTFGKDNKNSQKMDTLKTSASGWKEGDIIFLQKSSDDTSVLLHKLNVESDNVKKIIQDEINSGSTNFETDISKNNIYILTMTSFNFGVEIVKDLAEMVEIISKDATHVIFDFNQNSGGYFSIATLILHCMFPSTYPFSIEYVYNDSKMIREFEKFNAIDKMVPNRDLDTDVIIDVMETIKDYRVEGEYGNIKITDTVSELQEDDIDQESIDAFYKIKPLDLPPNRAIILTDGYCGSTCASFAKRAYKARLAILIGQGGSPLDSDVPYDIGSFPGGNVFSMDYIYDFINETMPDYNEEETPATYKFMKAMQNRLTSFSSTTPICSVVSENNERRFSEDELAESKINEYRYDEADRVLSGYSKKSAGHMTRFYGVVPELLRTFGIVGKKPSQLQNTEDKEFLARLAHRGVLYADYDSNTKKPAYKTEDHKRYAYDIEDKETLHFHQCELGYYVNQKRNKGIIECIRRMDLHKDDYISNSEPETDNSLVKGLIAAVCILSIFFIVCLILALVYGLKYAEMKGKCKKIRKNKFNSSETNKLVNVFTDSNEVDVGIEDENRMTNVI